MNMVSPRAAKNTMFDFVHLAVLCDAFQLMPFLFS